MQTEKRSRGRPKSGLTLQELQARSEAKRGVKLKGFKLHQETIELIERLAEQHGISQTQVIVQAVELFNQKGV
ncbi:hypothetical protein Q7469_02990 [Glaesserella parasuis]|uniref:hypothetical protein n=1 Tax=Glaesserella parasuis TaxID=738 RepID=UPI0003ABDACB|nr:hypothetical protein [Glaesserella parasuis]EQA03630.1 hypothetical protein HPSSW114_0266 [Glaesserella parasuis SW114]MDD2172226.1 hypothetical protein [Glaesserella parasuis]MDG6345227.1 hypothetical protein [Glaesserella parasuis]MDG6447335.1 hypothetical protein [Glaesserella parasuis]MDG6475254.1 hypothetical protein [Glaesserella parasuis]